MLPEPCDVCEGTGKDLVAEESVREIKRLTKERDEALAALNAMPNTEYDMRLKLDIAERERDEARDEAAGWETVAQATAAELERRIALLTKCPCGRTSTVVEMLPYLEPNELEDEE